MYTKFFVNKEKCIHFLQKYKKLIAWMAFL